MALGPPSLQHVEPILAAAWCWRDAPDVGPPPRTLVAGLRGQADAMRLVADPQDVQAAVVAYGLEGWAEGAERGTDPQRLRAALGDHLERLEGWLA